MLKTLIRPLHSHPYNLLLFYLHKQCSFERPISSCKANSVRSSCKTSNKPHSHETCCLLPAFLSTHIAFGQWNTDKNVHNAVSAAVGNQFEANLCSDGANGMIVAYLDDDQTNNALYDIRVQRLNANGQAVWATPTSLNFATPNSVMPELVEDGAGGAVIVAYSNGNIWAQRVDANGQKLWNGGNTLVICNAANFQTECTVVNAGDGYIFVWQDDRGTNTDLYALKITPGGQIANGWTVNGSPVSLAVDNQTLPRAIPDGAGGAFITWADRRSGTNLDIYAQRIDGSGVRQWVGLDGLLSGRLISGASANQNVPKIVSDGSGGAIIAWQDFRTGNTNSTDIYAQRVSAGGVVQWTANGVLVSSKPAVQTIENLVFTGDGVIVNWIEYPQNAPADSNNILAQKISLAGAVQWATDAVIVDAVGNQNNSHAAPDGAGGALFAWLDRRGGFSGPTLLYMQRLNQSGAPLWTGNGVQLSTRPTDQVSVRILNAGAGTLATWTHGIINTNTGTAVYDVYATRLDGSGNIQSTPLPLTWLSFTAQPDGQHVQLTWRTTEERNTSHFEIERSSDGRAFRKIMRLQSQNRPGNHQYRLTDRQPLSGANFYRIKQVDQDGRYTYSPVAKVSLANGLLVQSYPSPVKDVLILQWNGAGSMRQIRIYNGNGQLVSNHQPIAGTVYRLSVHALKTGVYYLAIEAEGGTCFHQFTKSD